MKEIDKIALDLFEKIRTRFESVNLGDENAKATRDPEKARFFNFEYTINPEQSGNVTVSIINNESLRVYYGTDISGALSDDAEERQKWYEFLKSMRHFAKRNMLGFDTRDIAKSNLELKDIKQQSTSDASLETDEFNITESRLYGTSRNSFADIGECKLRIIHSDSIDEEKHGARSRKIDAIFIETPQGERFLVKHKNLPAAAALATHISSGGNIHDEISESIDNMVAEMASMSHFVRSVKRRTDLDEETAEMAQAAVDRYNELKQKLKRLRSPRHYLDYVESFMPESAVEDQYDVDALRERFVKKMYDERFDTALPFVYRAYQKKMEAMNNPMAEEFESWADSVLEGTWALPDNDKKIEKLADLLSKPLKVGIDGLDATGDLYDIIGDDELFDDLTELADQDPETDARGVIEAWLQVKMPEVYRKVMELLPPEQPEQQQAQAQPILGTPQPAEQQAAAPAPVQQPTAESADPLDFIKTLAGLRK